MVIVCKYNCLPVSGSLAPFMNLFKSKWTVGAESIQGAMSKEGALSIRFRLILDSSKWGKRERTIERGYERGFQDSRQGKEIRYSWSPFSSSWLTIWTPCCVNKPTKLKAYTLHTLFMNCLTWEKVTVAGEMAVAAAREGRLEDWWAGAASTDCTEAWLTTPTLTAPVGGVALRKGAPLISSTGEPARPCRSGDPRPGVCTHNSKRSTDVNTQTSPHFHTHLGVLHTTRWLFTHTNCTLTILYSETHFI